jgi:hypothetical protein
VIRWIVGHAFLRWGIPGVVCSVLLLGAVGWWLASMLGWLVDGAIWTGGFLAAMGWLLLLIFLVRWLRSRRSQEHLLGYGRRRW